MIKRKVSSFVKDISSKYPVTTIMGPRQSGKTTLVKDIFKNKPYVNLENLENREFAEKDPVGFLKEFPDGVIIDEIQRVPSLLSQIQVLVDEKQKDQFFILTGSQQLDLMSAVTQSLAGRTALIKLLPLSIEELFEHNIKKDWYDLIYTGGYPRIYDKQIVPTNALSDYYSTYVERDIRQISNVHNMNLFNKFIKLCAGRVGQILDLTSLGNDTGVSHTTAKHWLSILEASYITFRLEPFYNNLSKRIIKSPKLYFYDVGLVSYLLGIENVSHVKYHPLIGNLYENLVVSDVLKYRFNRGKTNNINFYRDSNNTEVDLIYNVANNPLPIEIKSAQTISTSFFKGLKSFEKSLGELKYGKFLVYNGEKGYNREGINIMNFKELNKNLDNIF